MMEGHHGSCLTAISISVTLHVKPISNQKKKSDYNNDIYSYIEICIFTLN